ncbi:MAG: hypothetical protein K0U98_17170 [Deltaproteobacteria bacterium]|nr:hypothetical protein [Deltaproteobacteria bacterium]
MKRIASAPPTASTALLAAGVSSSPLAVTQDRIRFQVEQSFGPLEGISPLEMDYDVRLEFPR